MEATLSSENLGLFRKSSSVFSFTSVAHGKHIKTKRAFSPYFEKLFRIIRTSTLQTIHPSHSCWNFYIFLSHNVIGKFDYHFQSIYHGMIPSSSTNDCCHLQIAIFLSTCKSVLVYCHRSGTSALLGGDTGPCIFSQIWQ